MEGATKFSFELKKRREKTFIEVNEKDLKAKPDKILQILKKECVDLKSWFCIIVNSFLYRLFFTKIVAFLHKRRL
jgi:hypothetical protein